MWARPVHTPVARERLPLTAATGPPVRATAENHGIESTSRDRLRLVATDFFALYRPSECDLRVWLRAHDVEEAPPGPYSEVLIRLGDEHERRHLARFPNHVDLGELAIGERAARTHELVAENRRVIYQGALVVETTLAGVEVEIVGVPDFLLPARAGYAIRDSKLARRIGGGRNRAIELQLARLVSGYIIDDDAEPVHLAQCEFSLFEEQ